MVATWFSGIFSKAWSGITTVWSKVKGFFSGVWDGIKNIFSGVKEFFRKGFADAYNVIEKIFKPITNFFNGIWTGIKNIFSKVGEVVGKAIKSTVEKAVNGVLNTATKIINGFISAINGAISVINAIPGVKIDKLEKLKVPQLERGGILKKGEVGLLEGNGAEAVVPLDRNKYWIKAVVDEMKNQLANFMGVDRGSVVNSMRSAAANTVGATTDGINTSGGSTGGVVNNYTQNIYSPKQLDRLDIYRQSKNLLGYAGGGF